MNRRIIVLAFVAFAMPGLAKAQYLESGPAWPQENSNTRSRNYVAATVGQAPVPPAPPTFETGPLPAGLARPTVAPLQERTAAVSKKLKYSDAGMKSGIVELQKALKEAFDKHEKAPDLLKMQESKRIAAFVGILEETVELGNVVITQKEKFRSLFDGWHRASLEAGPIFRAAEKHFLQRSEEERVKEAKDFYAKSATWYAARAVRAELLSKVTPPTDFDREMLKIERMNLACKELLKFVSADVYVDTTTDGQKEIADFFKAFKAVDSVLDDWTKTLLKDLEPAPPEPAASPAVKDQSKLAAKPKA